MSLAAVPKNEVTLPETWLDDSPDFDAIAAFDEGSGAGREDPYPLYEKFRRAGGIVRHIPIGLSSGFEGDDENSEFRVWQAGAPESPLIYGIYSNSAITEVLRNSTVFSSTGYADLMGQVFGHSILEMDHPEHSAHRSLMSQAFRPKVIDMWENGLVREVIQQQIDGFKADGRADLTKQFTLDYPVKVIAGMMGVPLEHSEWFRRRAIEEISIQYNIERGLEAARVLKAFFEQIIAARRNSPGTDIISELVLAELDGHSLSDEEILPFLMLLSPAGAETTYRSTGNLLYGLLCNPDQLDAVKADRSLVPQAIEEAIRWETPLTAIPRWALCESAVEGVPIPKGTELTVHLASGNRDKTVWGDDADSFNIFRPKKSHVAFSTGRHTCLGIHLARKEMSIALNMLLDQLPNLRLDPAEAESTFIDGQRFRAPNKLKVSFSPVK